MAECCNQSTVGRALPNLRQGAVELWVSCKFEAKPMGGKQEPWPVERGMKVRKR